jgi:hypothetical protein
MTKATMQTQINCYFNHAWDSETHPDLADKKAAITLAKSLAPNVKNFEYSGSQADGFEFYFTEIVTVTVDFNEGDCLADFDEVQNAQPLILGGEMTTARRVR